MNDIYSFYQLISKYQIEIPIIQRDYAQGRNNSKAANVRKSLVDNMIKAVKEDKPLFFDFVYGRVDNNKFIPFDGQQRLTTLFLFHKYVFEKCQSDSGCNHKDNCSCGGILGRFSYATRQSSREFCEKLVQEKNISGNSLTDNIKNQSWFYPDWEKDPTVMGMLTMLDEIHCQMRNETDFKTFAEKLTSGCNCPITFHFVDMGEHKMSDETYVKMNARGKTLTPFENFKASLEQYLEEKNEQELLSRLKGKNDKSKQKYTGIDGSWLDLFWKVTNKEKQENEGKELPDSLMLSFFNRHFMNVWRSWYANNSKSEKKDEYDAFNTRIQKEMPLYPTKDDFVSFDIYQFVMDKCDTDSCLTPIFNIFDALSTSNNTIEKDCQAVWDRNCNEFKWSIFYGDINNQNRETYPSRIAFYATMKYFEFNNDNFSDTTSLSQWMRVVWNIIENSTIDSSDTYHATLRLIEKLSTKSHTIYNALANEFESFELGNQYHAQEQVAEEIEKAKQILNGKLRPTKETREEIIIEAETYSFFYGAIRFLFQDEKGDVTKDSWDLFDNKLKNAKKYFDENGVKCKYKDNALLLRVLLSRINIGESWFGYDKGFWRASLLSNDYQNAIHYLLTTKELVIEETCGQDWIKNNDLLKTLLGCYDSWHILNNWRDFSVLTRYSQRRTDTTSPKEIIVLNNLRNKILSSSDDIIVHKNNKIENTKYLYGWDIQFTYKYNNKEHHFQWHRDGYVRMIKDLDNCEPFVKDESKDAPEEKWYCFWPTQEMASDPSKFTDALNELINQMPKL